EKLVARLAKGNRTLSFCYEAGPCGYGLFRQLVALGHDCMVAAPSLIPMKAGDRVKTDGRDAVMLAKLHRAGELTAVWVPDDAHEAMRDLIRARATAVGQGAAASARLSPPAWTRLRRQEGVDPGLPPLADDGAVRPCRPASRAPGLHTCRYGRRGAGRASVAPDRGSGAELVAGPGRRSLAGHAGGGVDRRRDTCRRSRRLLTVRQSSTVDGLSRPGSVRALQRTHRASGGNHQGRECVGAPRLDRGRLDLSHATARQPQAA